MAKKIRDSLSAKVFLWIALGLIMCSLLIYAIVMICLPQSYTVVASSRVEKEIRLLTEKISRSDYEDSTQILEQFSLKNQASVILTGAGESQSFGLLADGDRDNVLTTSLEVNFADRPQSYTLSITAPVSPGHELTVAFLKMFPLILLLITVISAASAFLCSRVLVRPVLEISRVSKRMAHLDMTWDCKVNRGDELGVLQTA